MCTEQQSQCTGIARQDDQPSTLCMCIQSETVKKERVLRKVNLCKHQAVKDVLHIGGLNCCKPLKGSLPSHSGQLSSRLARKYLSQLHSI